MITVEKGNLIEVTGGNKKQRQFTTDIAHWCIRQLMPRMRTLDVWINLKKELDGGAEGYCWEGENNRQHFIEIKKTLKGDNFKTCVMHEMVHVKQFARRETCGYGVKWKGKKITPKTPYYDLPWEKEAYKMQDKLAQIVWDADVL